MAINLFKVDLGTSRVIRGVVTQGRSVLEGDTADEYVTQYRLLYSNDGNTWQPYSSLTVNDQVGLHGDHDACIACTNGMFTAEHRIFELK